MYLVHLVYLPKTCKETRIKSMKSCCCNALLRDPSSGGKPDKPEAAVIRAVSQLALHNFWIGR